MSLTTKRSNRLVLFLLTWQLRVVTTDQLQRILTARFGLTTSAARTVRPLVREGLLNSARTAATFVESTSPLFVWTYGDKSPDPTALAWQLEKRWRQAQTRTVTICWSTRRAAQLLGGMAPFRGHAGQLEHDLGTASILTTFYETDPDSAAAWVGEDILRRDYSDGNPALKKNPDGAFVADDQIRQVIEFGGQYSARRIRRFHRHFARHRVPYAIY
jgi:hypothetical protein